MNWCFRGTWSVHRYAHTPDQAATNLADCPLLAAATNAPTFINFHENDSSLQERSNLRLCGGSSMTKVKLLSDQALVDFAALHP